MSRGPCGECANFRPDITRLNNSRIGQCDVVLPPWVRVLLRTIPNGEEVNMQLTDEHCTCSFWQPKGGKR